MKKIISASVALILFGTLFLASCAKQDDPATPANSDPREKFCSNWQVSENSKDYGASTYNCTISDGTDDSHILFAFLYGFNSKTNASVNGNNFTIPSQLIQGHNVSGGGVLSNANRINMTYLVQNTATHYDTIKAVFTK